MCPFPRDRRPVPQLFAQSEASLGPVSSPTLTPRRLLADEIARSEWEMNLARALLLVAKEASAVEYRDTIHALLDAHGAPIDLVHDRMSTIAAQLD